MEDKDIYKIFLSVSGESEDHYEPIKKVFSSLIKITLKYRDSMLDSSDIIITVEDVRTALEWLVPALKTGRLPKTDNKIGLNLLKLWLDELKCNL